MCGGLPPNQRNLGLDGDGNFDPHLARHHDLAVVRTTYGGRARLHYAYFSLPYHYAIGLRDSLAAALCRLDKEIEAAEADL